jgi:hypothetical protein
MDKRIDGLAGAMREIAERRDSQLGRAEEISAERREQLQAFLTAELPVETALFAAAKRRDESLNGWPVLPAMVRATLFEQTRSVGSRRNLLGAYRTAAAIAAAIVVTFVVLQLSRSRDTATPSLTSVLPSSIMNADAATFFSDATPLTLRVSRLELASLDRSRLLINRALPDFDRAHQPLPLDLPIRPIRLDVEAVRMP